MDKHLERNLQKVESLRARGEAAKARRKLAELAQEHPDTPAYRLELGRTCLELGDPHAGLAEIRAILRQHPDLRADALAVVMDSFRAAACLPTAQFLFEDHLGRGEHEEAALALEPLAEAQLRQALERYATKLASLAAHRDLAAASDGTSRRLARWASLHLSLALKEFDAAAAHGVRLLRAEEDDRRSLLALLERRARTQQTPPCLLALLGEARAREGKAMEGLSALLAAAEREPRLIAPIEAIVTELAPQLTDVTALLRARGHLARLAGRHEEAVALYRDAVARDPRGTSSLLELLAPAAEAEGPEARPYALLRVELLARVGDGPGLAATLERLRTRPWLDPATLGELLSPHLGEAAAPSVAASVALLAIETGDIEGLARLLDAGPALSRTLTAPLTRALEQRLNLSSAQPEYTTDPITGELVLTATATGPPPADLPVAERPRWLAALVRLHAAAADTAGVNARLPLLWTDASSLDDAAYGALRELTRAAFAAVTPAPATVGALLGPLAARGDGALLRPWLAAVAAGDPEELAALATVLTTAATADNAQVRSLREALESPEVRAIDAYALPRLAARLFGGDESSVLPDLAAFAEAHPRLEPETLALLFAHAARYPGRGDVALAAARMLRVDDRLDEAVALLRPVFAHDPARVEEASLFFESLLAAEPDRADVWTAYLDGLAAAGRCRRLAELLPRAERALPAAQIGRLRAYRAHLLCEEGNLVGALSECELALQLADPPLTALTALLRAVLAVDPGLARAQKLLGDVLGAAGDLKGALSAHGRALCCDPAQQTEVLHAVRRLTGGRVLGANECIGLARFYLEAGRGDDAAAAYLEALQIDAARAQEIAADLADGEECTALFPSLLQPLARAWRLLGRPEEAEAACTSLYARDTGRADWIYRELALLEETSPEALPPVRARARILLAERRPDDVTKLLATALHRLRDPEARRQLAREFGAHFPADAAVEEAAATPEPPVLVASPSPEAMRPSLAPGPDPTACEQASRVAAAERLALADRPLEAIRRLRQIPLAGAECRLTDGERARALWLLAHAEQARGGWAAACACYRELLALPDETARARGALNRCYGRFLQDTVTESPLVLEKTAALR